MNTNREIIINEINNNINNINELINVFMNLGQGIEGLTKDITFKIREINSLDRNQEVLLVFYYSYYDAGDFWSAARTHIWCTTFLEEGILVRKIIESEGWSKDPDTIIDYYWHEIEEVEAKVAITKNDEGADIKHFYICFYFKDGRSFENLELECFGYLSTELNSYFVCDLINSIIEKINNQESVDNNDLNQTIENIRNKANNNEFKESLEIIKNQFDLNRIIETDIMLYYFLVYHTALCQKGLGNNLESLKILNDKIIIQDESDGFKEWSSSLYNLKAELNQETGNYLFSLQDYYKARESNNDLEVKSELNEKLNSTYIKFKDTFSELKYEQRKTILINEGIKPSLFNDFLVLDKSNLPTNIKFPFNHPKKEELYIGHPYIEESYLPYSSYETSLFNDRFEEFSYFIQCLGASSMTIKVIKENEKHNNNNTSRTNDASGAFGKSIIKNTANSSVFKESNKNNQEDTTTSRVRTQKFKPIKKPYIPENLLWYPHETSWNRLYQQRINGNILQHHDVMSSKNFYSINEKEIINLKGAFKNYFIEANINIDSLIENTFSQNEKIEWEIEIEFESIDNLLEENIGNPKLEKIQTLNDYEKEYLDEVKFMLEDDGVVDEKERSILERYRTKKGISSERAMELEKSLCIIKDLDENEKEYYEEFRELLNDGEITDKERRILNRMATRLGINEERIKELETI